MPKKTPKPKPAKIVEPPAPEPAHGPPAAAGPRVTYGVCRNPGCPLVTPVYSSSGTCPQCGTKLTPDKQQLLQK